MTVDAAIAHVDVPRFLASVEAEINPGLRGRAYAVVPRLSPRAPVLDVSLEAWNDGVRKGMTFQEARKLLPLLRAVEPHWGAGEDVASRLHNIVMAFTPWAETSGRGHLFLDLSHRPTAPYASVGRACRRAGRRTAHTWNVAQRGAAPEAIRREIRRLGAFNCVIGIGRNKLVAKVADRAFKWREPRGDGVVEVRAGGEEEFFAPLPVDLLPGVERRVRELLDLLNVRHMGRLASLPLDQVAAVLGPDGPRLVERARGIDHEPIRPSTEPALRIGTEILFAPDTNDAAVIRARLQRAAHEVWMQMEQRGVALREARVGVGFADLKEAERTVKWARPVTWPDDLAAGIGVVLEVLLERRTRVRRIRIRATRAIGAATEGQLVLFLAPREERRARLFRAIRTVRARFGPDALVLGSGVGGA